MTCCEDVKLCAQGAKLGSLGSQSRDGLKLESGVLAEHWRKRWLGPLKEEQVEIGPLLGRGGYGKVYKGEVPSHVGLEGCKPLPLSVHLMQMWHTSIGGLLTGLRCPGWAAVAFKESSWGCYNVH